MVRQCQWTARFPRLNIALQPARITRLDWGWQGRGISQAKWNRPDQQRSWRLRTFARRNRERWNLNPTLALNLLKFQFHLLLCGQGAVACQRPMIRGQLTTARRPGRDIGGL